MTRDVSDVTHRERELRSEKSELDEIETWSRLDEFVRYGIRVCGGGRWTSQYRKMVSLSPYVEKPYNSKVIKSFVPELRSRKCFSCFGIPMLSVYVYKHHVHFTYSHISHIHICLSNIYPLENTRYKLNTQTWFNKCTVLGNKLL